MRTIDQDSCGRLHGTQEECRKTELLLAAHAILETIKNGSYREALLEEKVILDFRSKNGLEILEDIADELGITFNP